MAFWGSFLLAKKCGDVHFDGRFQGSKLWIVQLAQQDIASLLPLESPFLF